MVVGMTPDLGSSGCAMELCRRHALVYEEAR
jgi:hypothetical protein